ncbi:hypothetical protein GCM10007928_39000 [Sulfitobacter porphyrae]|nr:hypothetical protein GCM10007928_39000 [Sulfitobacter porphyrae]
MGWGRPKVVDQRGQIVHVGLERIWLVWRNGGVRCVKPATIAENPEIPRQCGHLTGPASEVRYTTVDKRDRVAATLLECGEAGSVHLDHSGVIEVKHAGQ